MEVIVQEAPAILRAFLTTVQLYLLAGVCSLALGSLTAVMYVSPLPPLRWAASIYIRLIRNTPLTVVFFFVVFGLPELGIAFPFFGFAVLALTLYTATFVAETLRSGIGAVQIGQVEAARSIGMGFGQTLRHVVMPQAARSVVAPMTSVSVSLFKNTSIAGAFFVFESISNMISMVNRFSSAVLLIMATVAAMYVVTGIAMGRGSAWLERRVQVLR